MSTPVRVDSYIVSLAETASTIRRARTDGPHNHDGPPSGRRYWQGCRHPDCRALHNRSSTAWKRRKGILPPKPTRGLLPAPLAKARESERVRRNGDARSMALRALRDRYRYEYEAFLAAFREQINIERGPLPGDDWYD